MTEYYCEYCCNFDKEHIGMDGTALCKLTNTLAYCEESAKDCKFFNIHTADVQKLKHGEWIYHPETFCTKSGFTCSVCKDPIWHSHDVKQAFKYCPNCGAKMDRKDDT